LGVGYGINERIQRHALVADINDLSSKCGFPELTEIIIYIRSISRIDPAETTQRKLM
jgi:hypothetical protein